MLNAIVIKEIPLSSLFLILVALLVIPITSKRLGHSKVSTTTDFYSHLMFKADEVASNTLAGIFLISKKTKRMSNRLKNKSWTKVVNYQAL